MNTDTPRTNKAFLDGYTFCKEDMMPAVAFASQLERELTAVTEQREYWANLWADLARECVKDIAKVEREVVTLTQQRDQWKDKYIQQNKDLGHELRDPNGTIWSECKRLQTELDAVTKQRDGLRSGIDYASDQLHTVTEQRDELLRYNEAFRKETLICADCDAIRKEEYDQAIEQRDRLADLVKQFIYILDITEESDSGRLFHPTNITSCRAGDLQKIGELVEALRRASRTTNQNEL